MADARPHGRLATLLFLNVFIIATCGLVYELLAGTLASYLLGNSVTQFSLVIGFYLSAMGLGSWLSGFLDGQLARKFLDVELAVALIGGLSAPGLSLAFTRVSHFAPVLYGVVVVIGLLVGLELPLLMRLLKDEMSFKDLVARVLTVDYIGALAASLLFPLLFVPHLGLVRTSFAMGICNAGVALWGTHLLAPWLERRDARAVQLRGALVVAVLVAGLIKADWLSSWAEDEVYADPIVHAETSPYQRIVVTQGRGGFQLFLDGNLQFSSADEYRYHEALVHPAMVAAGDPRRVLVLGGGDGLALREVLRHPRVEAVTLVDLDPAMTRLGRTLPPLARLNRGALDDPRVTVVNQDAFVWLADGPGTRWDVVVIDFPDPNSFALGKLYTTRFYRMVAGALAPGGALAIQATSPLFARRSFWCIARTLEAAGFVVHPYQTPVPSFGVWGFMLARAAPFEPPTRPPAVPLRYLDAGALAAMFEFPADMARVAVDVNRLDDQTLVRYYESEWRRWEE